MSVEPTTEATYQAKDGLWYSCYEDMCFANQRRNQLRLVTLGLASNPFSNRDDEIYSNKKKRRVPSTGKAKSYNQTDNDTASSTKEITPPLRRSMRSRKILSSGRQSQFNKDNNYDDDDLVVDEGFDEAKDGDSNRPTKATTTTGVVRRRKQQQLPPEDLQKLVDLPDWLEDLHHFLLHVPHGSGQRGTVCSHDNARSVMRQVYRLVSGQGVTYHHWPDGTIFLPKVCVTLDMNLNDIFDQAVDFEAAHGRDKGNGWLLRHPIRKLQLFQQYQLQKITKQQAAKTSHTPPPSYI
jgi:hypothetical protein